MKQKSIVNFWYGFFIATVATAWLYWLWRRNREVLPEPVFVSRRRNVEPPAGEVEEDVELVLPPEKAGIEPSRLTAINGIGPAYERRLNDIGIFTFAQLADMSPEQLQDITGGTRWNPADWIEEARRLAKEDSVA